MEIYKPINMIKYGQRHRDEIISAAQQLARSAELDCIVYLGQWLTADLLDRLGLGERLTDYVFATRAGRSDRFWLAVYDDRSRDAATRVFGDREYWGVEPAVKESPMAGFVGVNTFIPAPLYERMKSIPGKSITTKTAFLIELGLRSLRR